MSYPRDIKMQDYDGEEDSRLCAVLQNLDEEGYPDNIKLSR